eukprot:TRINITY_DN75609_c0_g1_i1.p1 TRINITY_DN75609_c0_g1~~TRINITY_DN75609_c0_g1_i1.p1  ORF type:complete len:406 (-),score=99.13 TRINITY_DN75609_c0_g1_i1:182-1399(-)
MDIELFSLLSGEPVAALQALPSETIFNLKEKLYLNSPSACTFVTQLCLDGAFLEDTTCIGDLKLGSKPELQVMRTRKGARELLFVIPEAALCLAQHYDALGAVECKKQLSALFVDADGNERGRRAKMEILHALCQRLSEPKNQPNLFVLKLALAELAVELLRQQHNENDMLPPTARCTECLLRCFLWLGQEALLILLGHDLEVKKTLVSEFAKHSQQTLTEMLQQLPNAKVAATSPEGKLRSILQSSLQLIKDGYSKRCVRKGCGYRHGIDNQVAEPTLLDSSRQVLAATSKNCFLHVVDEGTVELRCKGISLRKATRCAALDAILQEPDVMLQQVDCFLALEAVEKSHGIYGCLPEHLQADPCILYAALEQDDRLLSEFLSTASKHEIRKWQWHMEQRPVKTKR